MPHSAKYLRESLLAEVDVKKVCQTVTCALHLLVYKLCRELYGLVVEHRSEVRIPLVDNLVVKSYLVYPLVKVALYNLLNLALLENIELVSNLVVGLAIMNKLRHLVIYAVELILFAIEGAVPEATRTWNIRVGRAVHIAHKVENHTEVENYCAVCQTLILTKVVVSNLNCVDAVTLVETWVWIVDALLVYIVNVPRCCVCNRFVFAVGIHPYSLLLEVVVHILGDVLLRLLCEVALCNLNNYAVTYATPSKRL